MLVDDIIKWYEKNVNFKLTKSFINFLIKTGVIKKDSTLEDVNLFLLERYGENFVKENGLFKMKKNRIDVIKNFPDTVEEQMMQSAPNQPVTPTKKVKKFKIENLGGKKLKLVKA